MVKTGLDVWVEQGFSALKGLKVGAIVNPSSVDGRFRHAIDLLHEAPGVSLSALFGPEHGLRGEAQYMVAVDDVLRDPSTQVPIHSLYGSTFESLTPRAEWLAPLDALVFDLQDVGCRYYTYISTMALAMKAAAAAKKPLYVLDRPNPLGLTLVEGNLPQEKFSSFVGLYSIPNRHGMTVGELAQLFNREARLGAELNVICCEGLSRAMKWHDTGRAFVPPSPNMPTVDTALVYPGMCLLEGTNVSEGRGTCRPFEQFGAPFLKGRGVAQLLNGLGLPGVVFRACAFTPTFDKFRGQSCEGAFLHVTDAGDFRPVMTGIAVARVCHQLGEGKFQWRADAYEFVKDIPAFDLLCGTHRVREGVEAGWSLEQLLDGFGEDVARFDVLRRPYALYD